MGQPSNLQEDALWMVLPFVQGGSVESAMKYAFSKVSHADQF